MTIFARVRARVLVQLTARLPLVRLTKAAGDHAGLWLGFWLAPDAAAALAVPGGEPARELHVTLCYVPDAAALGDDVVAAAVVNLRTLAGTADPFVGAVTGGGRFDAGPESDGRDVLYAVPDFHGLSAFREACVTALEQVGASPSRAHDFTPHVALKYVDAGSPETVDPPGVPLRADTLEVRIGDEVLARLPFGTVALAKATREADASAEALEALDLSDLSALEPVFAEELEALALAGARQALVALDPVGPATGIALPSDAITAWARAHAAALVGRRVLADGTVIDNPTPGYALDDATRAMLRETIADAFAGDGLTVAQLEQALVETYAFSAERAAVIAQNEVGRALIQGNLAAWRASGVVDGVEWILGDEHVADECDANTGVIVSLGDAFPSGDEAPPAHPRCACDVLPRMSGSAEASA